MRSPNCSSQHNAVNSFVSFHFLSAASTWQDRKSFLMITLLYVLRPNNNILVSKVGRDKQIGINIYTPLYTKWGGIPSMNHV